MATHRAMVASRKELNSLVSAYARKSGARHAVVHADLRQTCGGPTLDQANAAQVAHRIEQALEFITPDRLVLGPDCGMKYLSRDVAFAKLRALVAGAASVRSRLP